MQKDFVPLQPRHDGTVPVLIGDSWDLASEPVQLQRCVPMAGWAGPLCPVRTWASHVLLPA